MTFLFGGRKKPGFDSSTRILSFLPPPKAGRSILKRHWEPARRAIWRVRMAPGARWPTAFRSVKHYAENLYRLGVHKQIVNRLLEPFYNINVIVTATEWDNFFELRDHPDAQPEIRALAIAMKEAISKSKPNLLEKGQWHLPYVNDIERHIYPVNDLIKISVARCARVSYKTHDDKEPEFTKDLILYDRLVGSKPLHASPAEHQARPREIGKDSFELCGNFQGWVQYRKTLESDLIP